MSSETDARWKRDFPVPSEEDSYVTRREFTKFLGLTSLAFLAGTFAAAARKLLRRGTRDRGAGEVVASVEEVGLGGYKLFRYPTENDPCILLRLSHDRFVAFNQNCTHLSCPVHLKPDTMQLVCPCHKGFFNADDGRPVAGPPKRPLPALPISIRDGQVWVAPSEVETA
jgi:Rieske Fe-S protein